MKTYRLESHITIANRFSHLYWCDDHFNTEITADSLEQALCLFRDAVNNETGYCMSNNAIKNPEKTLNGKYVFPVKGMIVDRSANCCKDNIWFDMFCKIGTYTQC